ncbi:MAG: hypothetical protein HY296_07280 [Thaumarchaeota archaeon]|nr:hypothetical protein [Nitrososphaerota archaeon]
MKGAIQSLEASYHIHATEDFGKVGEAVSSLLGTDTEPRVAEAEGHFGNAILQVSFHLTGNQAGTAFTRVVKSLSPRTRAEILAALGSFMDEHSALYLRLDKQALVGGASELAQADTIRIKAKPRLFSLKGGASDFYRTALEV